jgi:hypothetical protein
MAPSVEAEFLDVVNRMLPSMGPMDVQPWAQYLYAQAPTTYGTYAPETVAAWRPPRFTPQQQQQLTTAPRYQQARQTMMPMIDPDSPVKDWLNTIFTTAEQFAPGSERVPGQRATRRQQQEYWRLIGGPEERTGLMGKPTAYGVPEQTAELWRPWLESFLAPTQERPPRYMVPGMPGWVGRSYWLGPQTNVQRGGTWANPRWL